MFRWLFDWYKEALERAYEAGRIVGRAEAETEALRRKMQEHPDVVDSTLVATPLVGVRGEKHEREVSKVVHPVGR